MLDRILRRLIYDAVLSSPMKRAAKKFADDLALTVQKAHLGKLPAKGQYVAQRVYTKKLTREELCVPLDADTLHRMGACKTVHVHEVHCQGIGGKMEIRNNRGNATLSVTIRFEGELENGEQVSVDIREACLLAEFSIHEIHGWTLNRLTPMEKA